MLVAAILFDLHHTLTQLKESLQSLMRRISKEHGLDLSHFSDDELNEAFLRAEEWLQEYQVGENVDPSWGELPEHWVPAVGIAFETLGFKDLSNDLLMSIESKWKYVTTSTDFEFFIEESIQAMVELHRRGYQLGICTRRHDNPIGVIERSGLQHVFSVVEWTGVPGYAKPSPYTLLRASQKLGVNPRLCAFVGNYVGMDIKAAIQAEMVPVLLTWATPHEAEKAPEGTILLESPLELLDIFEVPGTTLKLPY
ncbi:MAG: HAD family hydrolase [Candidatus Thorarchaeota archaeon]